MLGFGPQPHHDDHLSLVAGEALESSHPLVVRKSRIHHLGTNVVGREPFPHDLRVRGVARKGHGWPGADLVVEPGTEHLAYPRLRPYDLGHEARRQVRACPRSCAASGWIDSERRTGSLALAHEHRARQGAGFHAVLEGPVLRNKDCSTLGLPTEPGCANRRAPLSRAARHTCDTGAADV